MTEPPARGWHNPVSRLVEGWGGQGRSRVKLWAGLPSVREGKGCGRLSPKPCGSLPEADSLSWFLA